MYIDRKLTTDAKIYLNEHNDIVTIAIHTGIVHFHTCKDQSNTTLGDPSRDVINSIHRNETTQELLRVCNFL